MRKVHKLSQEQEEKAGQNQAMNANVPIIPAQAQSTLMQPQPVLYDPSFASSHPIENALYKSNIPADLHNNEKDYATDENMQASSSSKVHPENNIESPIQSIMVSEAAMHSAV